MAEKHIFACEIAVTVCAVRSYQLKIIHSHGIDYREVYLVNHVNLRDMMVGMPDDEGACRYLTST